MVEFTMPSILLNPDFNFLSGAGTTPTTQANGDNFEFIQQWFVVGASAATYTITPTAYANNALQRTGSLYYVHHVVTTYDGNPFYFYQRQTNTVRKYQARALTYTLIAENNTDEVIGVYFDIVSYYDPSSKTKSGAMIYLQPGMNELTSTIETQSLDGITVGATNYTEFRLNFSDLPSGTANINIYGIKCEFGKIGTPLNIDHYLEAARLSYA
jgi:hypothetical protein